MPSLPEEYWSLGGNRMHISEESRLWTSRVLVMVVDATYVVSVTKRETSLVLQLGKDSNIIRE